MEIIPEREDPSAPAPIVLGDEDPARSRSPVPTDGTGLGVGLGLSIVAAVVGARHGTVAHHPTPGRGATFRVLIPLAR